MGFFEKLNAAVARNHSLICVGLDPEPDQVPQAFKGADNPILAWNLALIEATQRLVCAYKPNIAFYEALGAPGLETLRATLAAIPDDIPVILDAKRGDIGSTAKAYARAIFDVWGADAVTVNPYLGWDGIAPFADYGDRGVFVLAHTSNPGAAEIQDLDVGGEPLYLRVARWAQGRSAYKNVGLVVGATYPSALAKAREVAPEAWFLVPGVGTQGGNLEASLNAGLRTDGQGLIVSASRSIAHAADPAAATDALRQAIQGHRPQASFSDPNRELEVELTLGLHRLGCIRFGEFTLASGQSSPFYIDLRLLVSHPLLLEVAARGYANILNPLTYDRLAAIPYAALPIATAIALHINKPLIYPRKEAKAYGTGRSIEGAYQAGETVVLVDDLISTGGSKLAALEPLLAAGLLVKDVIVLIDREQGGAEMLTQRGYKLHAVLQLRRMIDILAEQGRIDAEQRAMVLNYLNS